MREQPAGVKYISCLEFSRHRSCKIKNRPQTLYLDTIVKKIAEMRPSRAKWHPRARTIAFGEEQEVRHPTPMFDDGCNMLINVLTYILMSETAENSS